MTMVMDASLARRLGQTESDQDYQRLLSELLDSMALSLEERRVVTEAIEVISGPGGHAAQPEDLPPTIAKMDYWFG